MKFKAFQPSTDLGSIFAGLVSEAESMRLSAAECNAALVRRYTSYAQKGEGWNPEADPEFRQYSALVRQGTKKLAELREWRKDKKKRYWSPSLYILVALGAAACGGYLSWWWIALWFLFGDEIWARINPHIVDWRYQHLLGNLVQQIDALGDTVPVLQVGAPSPPRMLP